MKHNSALQNYTVPALALLLMSLQPYRAEKSLRVSNRDLQCSRTCEAATELCSSLEINDCNVLCVDACDGSTFNESTVQCSSCPNSLFRNSEVDCLQDFSCSGAQFFNSAIECKAYNACYTDLFGSCNCCQSVDNCPEGVEVCEDPQTGTIEKFCSTTFLGRTCKDWGNPECDGIETIPSIPPLHPASKCSDEKDIVECQTSERSCNDLTFESCSVHCIDACQNVKFETSTVACQFAQSCASASFYGSTVDCYKDFSCSGAQFFHSVVQCKSYNACYTELFDSCSCCLSSDNCPEGVELCVDPQTGTSDLFCSKINNDFVCSTWENPLCLSSLPTSSPTQITPTAMPTRIAFDGTTSPTSLPTQIISDKTSGRSIKSTFSCVFMTSLVTTCLLLTADTP